jgi:hypothetical protein
MHADLASYLAGAWTVARTATDRRAGTVHRMTGTARYTPGDDGIAYVETIQWTVNGQTFDAHRAYTLVPTGPWRAEVYFTDGRFFHALDLRTGRAEVAHACPPDHYAGWYALHDRDTHRTGWTITGPRKDIAITTRYTRIAARHRS